VLQKLNELFASAFVGQKHWDRTLAISLFVVFSATLPFALPGIFEIAFKFWIGAEIAFACMAAVIILRGEYFKYFVPFKEYRYWGRQIKKPDTFGLFYLCVLCGSRRWFQSQVHRK
jgi:hypothetical protein